MSAPMTGPWSAGPSNLRSHTISQPSLLASLLEAKHTSTTKLESDQDRQSTMLKSISWRKTGNRRFEINLLQSPIGYHSPSITSQGAILAESTVESEVSSYATSADVEHRCFPLCFDRRSSSDADGATVTSVPDWPFDTAHQRRQLVPVAHRRGVCCDCLPDLCSSHPCRSAVNRCSSLLPTNLGGLHYDGKGAGRHSFWAECLSLINSALRSSHRPWGQ